MGSWTTQPEARTAEPGVPISEVPRPPSPSTPRAHVPPAEPLGPGVMTEGLSTSQLPPAVATEHSWDTSQPPLSPDPPLPPRPPSAGTAQHSPQRQKPSRQTRCQPGSGQVCHAGLALGRCPAETLDAWGRGSFYPHLTDKEVEAGEPATRLRPGGRSWDTSPTLQPSPRDRVRTLRPPWTHLAVGRRQAGAPGAQLNANTDPTCGSDPRSL